MDASLVAGVAIAVAGGLFWVLTQVNINWTRAEVKRTKADVSTQVTAARLALIKEMQDFSAAVKADVHASLENLDESPQVEQLKQAIAELEARSTDSLLKFQGEFKSSLAQFGDGVSLSLNSIAQTIAPKAFRGGDASENQAKGVESRKINQIVNALDAGTAMGGAQNMMQYAYDLAGFLESVGEPSLAEWLSENPNKLPQIYERIKRIPGLAQRLQAFEQRMAAQVQGDTIIVQGGRSSRSSRGGDYSPGA